MRTDPKIRIQATKLRKQGLSLKKIHARLDIPLSTLSGWMRDVELIQKQKTKLHADWQQALISARTKASAWHRTQRTSREKAIREKITLEYGDNPSNNKFFLETALAMLYLGEGSKSKPALGLGNSDPKIIRFYVKALKTLYGVNPATLQANLHLRMDQDEETLKRFWSRESGIPLQSFRYVLRDKRTGGKPTYDRYKGVCFVAGGGVEIQRRLLYLAEAYCA